MSRQADLTEQWPAGTQHRDGSFTHRMERTMFRQTQAAVGGIRILPAHHTITSEKPLRADAWTMVEDHFTTVSKSQRHCAEDAPIRQWPSHDARQRFKIQDSRAPCFARNKEQSLTMSISLCHMLCPFVSHLYKSATLLTLHYLLLRPPGVFHTLLAPAANRPPARSRAYHLC